MEIRSVKIKEIKPYDRNAKKHDDTQINNVAESIRQFGFVQPIVIDSNGVIVIGHCRFEAAKQLKYAEVPCIMVDDLTPEQVDALRIVDNKTNESPWDIDLLTEELQDLDLSMFDFDWDLPEDENQEYDNFYDKEHVDNQVKALYLSIANKKVEMTEEEYQSLTEKLERYVDDNGVSYGFVRWLLNEC
jgi:site-specific DNA-methyltransferase (adenine-specific)